MWYYLVGCAGFVLFYLYDVLQIKAPTRVSAKLFFIGLALLLFGTGGLIVEALGAGSNLLCARGIGALILATLFLFLLLHSLFFSLSKETYQESQDAPPPLVDTGLYALCRHPGVLFFMGLYICLWLAFGGDLLLLAAWSYSLLNLLYGLMQDLWSFPRQFAGYDGYRRRTPFLIPNAKSVRACVRTWNRAKRAASEH